MLTVDQVPLWAVERGIGHAVSARNGGYVMTACGTWGNLNEQTAKTPKRICLKCRERLKDATLLRKTEKTA
jgi:hypothetical protein